MKMNTKKLVLNSVLLGIGLVLHQIEPAIFGVKPDMTLTILYASVVLPAIVINLIVGIVVFKIIHVTMKRVSFQN